MNATIRLSAALVVLALFVSSAQAQIAIAGGGVAGVGVRGFGGFTGVGPGFGGAPLPVGGLGVASPYALSTLAGNPYSAGTLGVSPYGVGGYGLSTNPVGNFASPYEFNPPFFGYRQDPMNGYLTGVASVTSATGQYWKDIGAARLTREEARRSTFETARKQVELQTWYERQKPKTQDLVDAGIRTDLDRARRDPPMTEVVSGKSLNDLLNNIRKLGALNRGPNISLESDALKNLNVITPGASGGVGMLKNDGKVSWPLSLHEPKFDEVRARLSRKIEDAVKEIKSPTGDGVLVRLLRDVNADVKNLQDLVENSQDDLSISQQLQARSFMRQLAAATNALKDPSAKDLLTSNAITSASNVQELVERMNKAGLNFGPATPGNEASYMSVYYAIRAFEGGLALAQK